MMDLYLITYEDTSYLYKDVYTVSKKIVTPEPMQSVGFINEQTEQYVDVGLQWTSVPDFQIEKGIVIPMQAVLSIKKLHS